MGSELKSNFCTVQNNEAVVFQGMGDLEHPSVFADYCHHLDLHEVDPRLIAVDMHPNYISTQLGYKMAEDMGCGLIEVQHHHAHIAACMIEHGLGLNEHVLGIALDGLGMGENGALWGGEFLLSSYGSFQRIASMQEVPLIGGAKAATEPWRNCYAQLHAIDWEGVSRQFGELSLIKKLAEKPLGNIDRMITRNINSPMASSAGRLFDAVAAALDIYFDGVSFEAQAAIELEAAASELFGEESGSGYPVSVEEDRGGLPRLTWEPLWMALLEDVQEDASRQQVAARFHHGLIDAVADQAVALSTQCRTQKVVLSGGVFQNRLLMTGVKQRLEQESIEILTPQRFPAHDGGLSLGQAAIAIAQQA